MTVTILPATVSDARALTSTGLQAFSTDPLNKALENYSALDPTQRNEYLQWRTERNLDRMTGPGKFWFKAVDSTTGDLVGYVGMLAPKKTRPEPERSVDEWHASAPANTDLELFATFVRKLEEMQEELMGGGRIIGVSFAFLTRLLPVWRFPADGLQLCHPWLFTQTIKARGLPSDFCSEGLSLRTRQGKMFTSNRRPVPRDCI